MPRRSQPDVRTLTESPIISIRSKLAQLPSDTSPCLMVQPPAARGRALILTPCEKNVWDDLTVPAETGISLIIPNATGRQDIRRPEPDGNNRPKESVGQDLAGAGFQHPTSSTPSPLTCPPATPHLDSSETSEASVMVGGAGRLGW